MLIDAGCEVRGDDAVQAIDARVKPASDEDWDTEYEDAIIVGARSSTASTRRSRIFRTTARTTPMRS